MKLLPGDAAHHVVRAGADEQNARKRRLAAQHGAPTLKRERYGGEAPHAPLGNIALRGIFSETASGNRHERASADPARRAVVQSDVA
jgi:hypothetical protein